MFTCEFSLRIGFWNYRLKVHSLKGFPQDKLNVDHGSVIIDQLIEATSSFWFHICMPLSCLFSYQEEKSIPLPHKSIQLCLCVLPSLVQTQAVGSSSICVHCPEPAGGRLSEGSATAPGQHEAASQHQPTPQPPGLSRLRQVLRRLTEQLPCGFQWGVWDAATTTNHHPESCP